MTYKLIQNFAVMIPTRPNEIPMRFVRDVILLRFITIAET